MVKWKTKITTKKIREEKTTKNINKTDPHEFKRRVLANTQKSIHFTSRDEAKPTIGI